MTSSFLKTNTKFKDELENIKRVGLKNITPPRDSVYAINHWFGLSVPPASQSNVLKVFTGYFRKYHDNNKKSNKIKI